MIFKIHSANVFSSWIQLKAAHLTWINQSINRPIYVKLNTDKMIILSYKKQVNPELFMVQNVMILRYYTYRPKVYKYLLTRRAH
jgi:hypothetical protein